MSIITKQIIDNRKNVAPKLKVITDNSADLYREGIALDSKLAGFSMLPPSSDKLQDVRNNLLDTCAKFDNLRKLANSKYTRFSNGNIGIAVCGLMKAGKSTFLSNLLNIELPAGKEKSTAVSTEVHYVTDDEYAEIEYYTEDEFLETVINPSLGFLQMEKVSSINAFGGINIRPEAFIKGGDQRLISGELLVIQNNLSEIRNMLGGAPKKIRLKNLSKNISYPHASERETEQGKQQFCRIMSAKVCRIYAKYANGMANATIIDTPGVDDPNGKVVENTLKSLQNDTDIILLMVKPDEKPVLGKDFFNFWNALSNLKDAVNFIDRLVIVLNWNRASDPDKSSLASMKKQMIDQGVPESVFTESLDCSTEEGAAEVMEAVNRHLEAKLPKQDRENISSIRKEFTIIKGETGKIVSEIRNTFRKVGAPETILTVKYNEWFDNLIKTLRSELYSSILEFQENSPFAEQRIPLDKIIERCDEELNSVLPEASNTLMELNIQLGDGPTGTEAITYYLDRFHSICSGMTSEMAELTREFAPVIQGRIADILEKSGLSPLLQGDNAKAKLIHLKETLGEGNVLSDAVSRLLNLDDQMGYILQYQLRPALDLTNKYRWQKGNGNEYSECIETYTAAMKHNGLSAKDISVFKRIINIKDMKLDTKFMNTVAAYAHAGIAGLAGKELFKIAKIADDALISFQMDISGSQKETLLRNLLLEFKDELLGGDREIQKMVDMHKRIKFLNRHLDRIEDIIKKAA